MSVIKKTRIIILNVELYSTAETAIWTCVITLAPNSPSTFHHVKIHPPYRFTIARGCTSGNACLDSPTATDFQLSPTHRTAQLQQFATVDVSLLKNSASTYWNFSPVVTVEQ